MVAVRLMAPVTSPLESAAWKDRRGRHELELVGPLFHDLDGHVGLETRGSAGQFEEETVIRSARVPSSQICPGKWGFMASRVRSDGVWAAFGQRGGVLTDLGG